MKTFYIETFGCQMNAHDSEKVVGTLLAQGYKQVGMPEEADLVFYNTCSIRDKAEQKVFNRLQNFKREAGKGKVFGVLGCVAQQEGEKIFERAPHVSLVCGSASYRKLPEMLIQLEGGVGSTAREIPRPAGESAGLRNDAAKDYHLTDCRIRFLRIDAQVLDRLFHDIDADLIFPCERP